VTHFGPFLLDASTGLAALVGAVFGVAADRLAARWPAHEPPTDQTRALDWRTVVVALAGALTGALLVSHWSAPADLAVLGVYAAVLLVLLATDLDQRILPDELTLPLIVFALALLVTGWSPLVSTKSLGVPSAVAAAIGAPIFLLVTNRLFKGQLGAGDLKLVAGIGLMSGVSLLVAGVLVASVVFSVVLIALIAVRRITLHSLIPFGPVLILGGLTALALGGTL
jgi:leader peptidase (prepilin peptidase)/N-methyltransferase